MRRRLTWVFATLILGFVCLSVVGQATDPSVNTFPKWRWAGGTAGMLTEINTSNQVLVTLTGTPATLADSHEPSVNTFPKVRIAGGTSGNLAEVDSTGHLLVTGISTAIADGDYGDITVSSSSAVWTIDNDVVTYAKMQNVSAASKLLGRGDSGSGDPQEITLGTGLTMTGTTLSASGGCTLSGNDTEILFNDGGNCGSDTLFKWDKTNNILGIGGAAAAGTSGVDVLTMYGPGASAVQPTTSVTDAAQLYVRDYAATHAAFGMRTEDGSLYTFGRSLLVGTDSLSSTMVKGVLVEQLGNDDGILQFLSTGDVAHGVTSLGPTSMFADFRKASASEGGLQIRPITEGNLGLYTEPIITTETGIQTKTTTSAAATQLGIGLKNSTSSGDISGPDTNVFGVVRLYNAAPMLFLVDSEGDTWQPGSAIVLRKVEANTAGVGAPSALSATADSNKVATNEGVTAKNYRTLPAAAVTNGNAPFFTFVVQDADGLRVTAGSGDTIRIAAAVSGAAGFCESTTIGDSVTLVPINATEWMAVAVVGAGWGCT